MSEESRSSDAGGRFWQGLRALLLGNDHEITLRDQIEEAIEEHDEHGGGQGDLSLVERQKLQNLLHFGERRVIDVAVPRSDVIAFDDRESVVWGKNVSVRVDLGVGRTINKIKQTVTEV